MIYDELDFHLTLPDNFRQTLYESSEELVRSVNILEHFNQSLNNGDVIGFGCTTDNHIICTVNGVFLCKLISLVNVSVLEYGYIRNDIFPLH